MGRWKKRDDKFDEPLLLSNENCLNKIFFFFFFLFHRVDSILVTRHTDFLEFFFTAEPRERIGLPLNRVNKRSIFCPEERRGKIRRRSIIYICNFAIYRHRVRFQGCIVQPPTLSLASPPARHPREQVDLSSLHSIYHRSIANWRWLESKNWTIGSIIRN